MNPMNTTPGNWGMDPTYLTPNYAAPYRPQYQGPMGAPPPDYHAGFFQSVGSVYTPFGPSYNYGDRTKQEDPYFSAMAYRPADAAMWGAHRIAAPIAAFAAAMKISDFQIANKNRMWQGALHAGYTASGSSARTAAASARTVGLGWGLGDRFGSSVASGLIRGVGLGGATGTGAAIGAAGVIGGVVGAAALPMALGAGAMQAFESTILDPYQASALTERSLRGNSANIHAGTGGQNGSIGFGMSRKFAGDLSSKLTKHSIKDMSFDTYQMGELTDYAARSGMLDDSKLGQIEGKMKSIAKQIKVMMRVANEPDFKSAMEMLAELKVAGVSEKIAGRVMANLGGSASMAGVSVQKMMNTVGAQGQYLYQANGLTPYLGQVAAGNTYGAFASAFRQGLIDPATMAKFGGTEGATQLALTGQLNATQTPYNQLSLMNEYLLGGKQGSVVGNLSKMGSNAARDPLGAAGALGYYEHEFSSAQLMKEGSGAFLSQIDDISKNMVGMRNKNGSVDVEKAYLLMTRQMGIPEMEAKAMLKEISIYQDKGTVDGMRGALSANVTRDTMKAMEMAGAGNGPLSSPIYNVRKAWKGVKADLGGQVSDARASVGGVGDWLERKYHSTLYGDLVNQKEAASVDEFLGDGGTKGKFELSQSWMDVGKDAITYTATKLLPGAESVKATTGLDPFFSARSAISAINQLSSSDKRAAALVDKDTSKEERFQALDRLNSERKLDRKYSKHELEKLADVIEKGDRKEVGKESALNADKLRGKLRSSLGLKNASLMDSAAILDASSRLVSGSGSEEDYELMSKKYGSKSRTESLDRAEANIKNAAQEEVVHLGAIMAGRTQSEIEQGGESGDRKIFGKNSKEVKRKIAEIKNNPKLSEKQKKEQIDAVTFHLRRDNTGVMSGGLLNSSAIAGSMDAESIVGMLGQQNEAAKQLENLNTLASQRVINFDTKYSSIAALTLKQSVSDFGGHVQAFGTAIKEMGGGVRDSSERTSPLKDWIFGEDRTKR